MAKPIDPPTIVVFRAWRSDGNVIALFPELPHDLSGRFCTSYAHVGQHGAASYTHCIAITRPATPAEYAPLLKELRAIGYDNLIVRKRWQRRRQVA